MSIQNFLWYNIRWAGSNLHIFIHCVKPQTDPALKHTCLMNMDLVSWEDLLLQLVPCFRPWRPAVHKHMRAHGRGTGGAQRVPGCIALAALLAPYLWPPPRCRSSCCCHVCVLLSHWFYLSAFFWAAAQSESVAWLRVAWASAVNTSAPLISP